MTNNTVINGNELSRAFKKDLRKKNPSGLIENLPYKYGNLPNNNVINDNEVSTHDRAFSNHGELTI